MADEPTAPRLTELADLAGCTAKMGAAELQRILAQLTGGTLPHSAEATPDLIVGLDNPDDAAVYRLSGDRALVITLDFSAPLIDDPYCYGAVTAANALSDVYAMGADVTLALNIAAFPADMDSTTIAAILQGGADKVAEAGALIVGGHTIIDAEPKYGLCAVGFIHPDALLTKAGARAGEALYLTKPLGTGLVTTAGKFKEARAEHLDAAIRCMATLNWPAARIAREVAVSALTDVSGFGLLGHAHEMASAGHVAFAFEAPALPVLPGALEYAYRGILTGGEMRNRAHLQGKVQIDGGVDADFEHILFDPQTSGGLLFSVPVEAERTLADRFAAADVALWRIGEVREGSGVVVRS